MIITDGDARLTFTASTYRTALLPDAVFLLVIYVSLSTVSLRCELLDAVVNKYKHLGDVLIAPRRYSDYVELDAGAREPVYSIPGYTRFVKTVDQRGWDCLVTYDPSPQYPDDGDGVEYVIAGINGECRDVPRHVLLFHELCH